MNRERIQEALQPFGFALHQDAHLGVESFDDMLRQALFNLSEKQRSELERASEVLLKRYTPTEIKGFISRSPAQLVFDAKGSKLLLERLLVLLQKVKAYSDVSSVIGPG